MIKGDVIVAIDNNLTLKGDSPLDIESELDNSFILKSILGTAPFGLNLWNKNMMNIMCNSHILSIFNIESSEEFLDRFYEFSPKFQPNGILSAEQSRINFEIAQKNGKHTFNWLHITPSGSRLPCEITLVKINEEYTVGYIDDLRSEFDSKIQKNIYNYYFTDKLPKSILMEEIMDITDEWFFSIDLRTGNIDYTGKWWFSGFGANAIITESKMMELGFIHEEDIAAYSEMMDSIKSGNSSVAEIRLLNDETTYRYHRITSKLIYDSSGTAVFAVGKGVDIHEQKITEERAQKDLLTDCYNKISAEDMISEKLRLNNNSSHVLFIIDIDNFKAINDNLGHFFGDEVLRDIASGLKVAFRDNDIIARIGGDEFIVFVENLSDKKIILEKAEKILEVYRKTYSGEYKDYSVSGSVGIAIFPYNGATYDELYQNADRALNQAKIQGKNQYMVYSDDLNIGTTRSTTKIENANRMASSFFDYDLISAVFNILYEKNGDSDSINLTLSYICQKYGADRSYIFETLDEGATLNNTFEYCKDGISSEIDNLQGLPYELFVDFINKSHNDVIYSNDLRETLELDKAYEIMDGQGILSFVHAQVMRDDLMTFFIGLDDCTKTRIWTEREINSLQYIGKLLSIILQGTHLRDKINKLAISNKNSADILDNSADFVYVSDLETYDLLYLNQYGKSTIGVFSDEELKGQKCYKLLQGKDAPCEFCTNHLLNTHEYYEWSYYNKSLDANFLLKDKLIQYNGKLARLEIATDVSAMKVLEKTLTEKLTDEQFLMGCVEMLHSGNEPDTSIYSSLKALAEYYDAERSYIFEISQCGEFISNTYEFCKEGHVPYIDRLQNLPKDELDSFLKRCDENEGFYLNIDDAVPDALEYDLMKVQNLSGVTIAAIRSAVGEVTGLVGVDNPQKNKAKTSTIKAVAKFIANFLDETELISKLNNLSYHDTLTGIKNRHSYSLALENIDKNIDSLGVLYVDILGLSAINESKGMKFGDSVLVKLSDILSSVFQDEVFRVGGDEFVVISQNIPEDKFEKSIAKIKEILAKESDFSVSIGYTWNKNFNTRNNNLVKGETYGQILLENLEMEIEDGKYVVYLQPQVTLSSGEIESAEALVRRIGANDTLQPPIHFLPFYEKEGIISKIDEFVLETVCKALKSWKDKGAFLPIISVNCSRMTVSKDGIVDIFSKICDSYSVERSKIVIEITETINGIGENALAQIIKNFSDAGFLVSLDDFGSGYSNLNSLIISDFDEIKIDMTIVDGIHKDIKSKLLTKLAVDLCQGLEGVTSVAEGVEEKTQHDLLFKMGCNKAQGYHYAKPMPIGEFAKNYLNL